jgi:class 3 adenylate cyclase
VIDKFLGDGVMATFGAVVPSQTYACDALRAVEAVITAIESWNAERTAQGESAISVNASAASGSLIFSAVGDERRLEYTVIADPQTRTSAGPQRRRCRSSRQSRGDRSGLGVKRPYL